LPSQQVVIGIFPDNCQPTCVAPLFSAAQALQ